MFGKNAKIKIKAFPTQTQRISKSSNLYSLNPVGEHATELNLVRTV